jgi:DHA1 family chloramphenicol resistance protein-like MFS transporter
LLLVGWLALAVLADRPAVLFVLGFVQGALSFAVGSTLITRILYQAAGAPTTAGSCATAALNIGAAVGPLIAATTRNTGFGDLGPLWVSGLLVALALLIAFPLRALVVAGRDSEVLR